MLSKRLCPSGFPRLLKQLNIRHHSGGRVITQTIQHGRKKVLTLAEDGSLASVSVFSVSQHKKLSAKADPADAHNEKTTLQKALEFHPVERVAYHFRHTFLPAGYPHSVGANYGRYISWQAVHHLASAVNGVLASTFLLYGVGLGQVGAPATAGAINWVLKDGLGQLGTLYFGKKIAPRFDAHPKTWYLSASILLDVAVGLEISTFAGASHFLVLGSLANMLKGLAWMSGGSTRSAFNVSFTRQGSGDNIADLTAKATSQTICTSLLGTTFGIALASHIGQNTGLAIAAYTAITATHLFAGYRSVKCIPLASLNPTRLQLLLDMYLGTDKKNSSVPTPPEMAKVDPTLFFVSVTRDKRFLPRIDVGGDVYTELGGGSTEQLSALLRVFEKEHYMVNITPSTGFVHVVFRDTATERDCLRGYLQAVLLRRLHRNGTLPRNLSTSDGLEKVLDDTRAEASALLMPLAGQLAAAGWQLDRVLLEERNHRVSW